MTLEQKILLGFIGIAFLFSAFYASTAAASVGILSAVTLYLVSKYLDRKKTDNFDELTVSVRDLKTEVNELKLAKGLRR